MQSSRHGDASFKPGTTMLCYEEELSTDPHQPTTLQVLLGPHGDTEGSSNSEGSHATGDSGRYSHDETEMTNLSSGPSSRPSSLSTEDSGGSDGSAPAQTGQLKESGQPDLKATEPAEDGYRHHDTQSSSQPALSL